jgi:hypothetical protein
MRSFSRSVFLGLGATAAFLLLLVNRAPAQVHQPSGKPVNADVADDEVPESRVMLYSDKLDTEWIPGGWMPDGKGLMQNITCKESPHGGKYCIRCGYRLEENSWVGIGWLWLNKFQDHVRRPPNLFSRMNAKQGDHIVARFWARSKDRAWVKFQVGGGNGDSIAPGVTTDPDFIELSPEWKRYQIELTNQDISGVIQIFGSFLDRAHCEDLKLAVVQWDLDDIYFVKLKN